MDKILKYGAIIAVGLAWAGYIAYLHMELCKARELPHTRQIREVKVNGNWKPFEIIWECEK